MARSNSGALAASAVLATGVAQVKRVSVDNSDAANAYYVQLFNAASLPANGTVPDSEQVVAKGPATAVFDFNPSGERFNKGLVVALSTTAGALTVAGGTPAWFESEYY